MLGKNWHIYYSNDNQESVHRITKYDDFKDDCRHRDSYPFYESDTSDKRSPAMCSKYHIALDYVQDSIVDKILQEKNDCDNTMNFCDDGYGQKTFARLKGAPNLYFTTAVGERFPGRGVYIKVDNRLVIELWYYYVEFVECSCI